MPSTTEILSQFLLSNLNSTLKHTAYIRVSQFFKPRLTQNQKESCHLKVNHQNDKFVCPNFFLFLEIHATKSFEIVVVWHFALIVRLQVYHVSNGIEAVMILIITRKSMYPIVYLQRTV